MLSSKSNAASSRLNVLQGFVLCTLIFATARICSAESPTDVLQHYPADTEGTPTPVAETLKKATLPPGFQMTCFASEPDVLQPIAINIDDRGRLWVAECFSYPQWAATGRDRLTILEDTNGDGKFDKRKVFWAEGNYLTGFQLGYGGVFVCSAPDILFIPDKNGDDIPDGPPEKVLTGWSTAGKHNVVNGLQWGPDGWLYGCNGITSPSKVGRPETPEKDRTPISCGIWRYHVRDKKFEVVCHGGTNPWGLDWNEEGEAFFTNCVIGHLFHVIPGARYQRMFGQDLNPYAYELMPWTSEHYHWQGGDWTKARGGKDNDELGGGHAHSGAIFLHGDQWPAEMRGDLLMCNIHGNRINRDHIERTAAGYVGKYRPDLIKFNDPWFRGVGFAAAPDGSIYVADWCDVGECHDYKEVHRNSGRIYKFWHGELKKWKPEELSALKQEPHKVDAMKDQWSARRVLQATYEIGDKTDARLVGIMTEQILAKIIKPDPHSVPQNLFRINFINAVGIEQTLSFLFEKKQVSELYSELPMMAISVPQSSQISGLQLSERLCLLRCYRDIFKTKSLFPEWNEEQLLQIQTIHDDSLVLSLLGILQLYPIEVRAKILLRVWQHPTWKKSIPSKENYGEWSARRNLQCMTWYAMEPVIAADPKWAVEQLLACPDPWLHRLILRRLTDEKDNAKLTANLNTLFDNQTVWNNKDRTYDLLAALQAGLNGYQNLSLPKSWPALASKLTSHTDQRVRMQTMELSYQFGDSTILPTMLEIVANDKAGRAERERALLLLSRNKQAELAKLLPTLLNDSALRGHAIRALGAYQLADTPQLLLSKYDSFSLDEKLIAVETLAGRKAWATVLLNAVNEKKIPRADVPIFIARQIQLFKDDALNKQLHDAWGTIKANNAAMTERKQQLKQALTADYLAKSNASNGATLFKNNCVQCHTLLGTGGKVGPDLTGAQRGNIDYLLENILDPSGVVARDYRLSVITLNDGRVLSGVIAEETGAVIKLRTTSGEVSLAKSDIDEQTQTNQSAMPEGLLDKLSGDEIRDLIGYLQTAK